MSFVKIKLSELGGEDMRQASLLPFLQDVSNLTHKGEFSFLEFPEAETAKKWIEDHKDIYSEYRMEFVTEIEAVGEAVKKNVGEAVKKTGETAGEALEKTEEALEKTVGEALEKTGKALEKTVGEDLEKSLDDESPKGEEKPTTPLLRERVPAVQSEMAPELSERDPFYIITSPPVLAPLVCGILMIMTFSSLASGF
eukprot:GHVP01027945.1.p3 GENE.GHVP01027945.1~~GHVP01027945.1.p3  ORF type:complete len:197 (-),score=68.49 GHVP01027945.1:2266-2856(-)